MNKLITKLVALIAAAVALVPAITEAGMRLPNHNETLVRDR